MDDSLMKAREVANLFKVETHTVYVWAHKGKLPYSKINGCMRFKRSDLTKIIEAGRHERYTEEPGARKEHE